MVIVVMDNCVVVDFLQEASLQINEVLPCYLHYPHEAVYQPLYLLIVVQFIGHYGRHRQHPGAVLKAYLPPTGQAVPHHQAQRQIYQERLGLFVYERYSLDVHIHLRQFD